MDCYEIWVDLAPGAKDTEFVDAINAYLGFLQAKGTIETFRIKRRKFGFGPADLGEFSISIETRNLAQLDEAFKVAATRTGEVEELHRQVYSRVQNYKSGLYRDYPDVLEQ
ncbi:MAG: hypothetical protein JST40_01435 [Armatimonadetes bacterium]|nr:hypothetical protein [Armatimonadota bacterium]